METEPNHQHHEHQCAGEESSVAQFGKLEHLVRGTKPDDFRLMMLKEAVATEKKLQKSFDDFAVEVIGLLLLHDDARGVVKASEIEPRLSGMIAVHMNRVGSIIAESFDDAIDFGMENAEEIVYTALGSAFLLEIDQRRRLAQAGLLGFLREGAMRIPMGEHLAKIGADLDFSLRSTVRRESSIGRPIGEYKKTIQAIITGREKFSGELTRRNSAFARSASVADTEINGAYHRGLRDYVESTNRLVGYEWRLSIFHPRRDICDDLSGYHGLGDAALLQFQPHVRCMCYLIPVWEEP